MDQVNGNSNITELLVKKYKTLYYSVKTSEKEYCELHSAIADGVTSLEVSDYQVKPYIIEHCIKRLKHKELIDNYNRNGSNVYSCLLDASKAFDKIHYGKLFNVLLEKGVPFVSFVFS